MVTREAPGAQLRSLEGRVGWAYKDRITPNRKTGAQIVRYLQDKYVLEETFEHEACAVVEGKRRAQRVQRGKAAAG